MTEPGRKDVHRFFHINVNCTDYERSLAFYEAVGFEVVNTLADRDGRRHSFTDLGFNAVFRMDGAINARGCLMALRPDDLGAVRLDLLEWTTPVEPLVPRKNLAQPGVARICLKATDAQSVHDRLKRLGYEVYSEPAVVDMGGSRFKVFCAEDPDGIVLEFMEFLEG